MKLHQGPTFIDGVVNTIEVVVHSKTNFVEVVQNQLLFWKLILQVRHVTYREIDTTLSISGTSINSILHEYFFTASMFSSVVDVLGPPGRAKIEHT